MPWLDALKFDVVPLLLRLGFGGGLLALHGLPKLQKFSELSETFADPLGVGPLLSLSLALFAEVLCAGALVLGLFSRLTAIPPLVTMLVALLVVHIDDPWNKKELALVYAIAFVCLIMTGSGRMSLDGLRKWRTVRGGRLP